MEESGSYKRDRRRENLGCTRGRSPSEGDVEASGGRKGVTWIAERSPPFSLLAEDRTTQRKSRPDTEGLHKQRVFVLDPSRVRGIWNLLSLE